MSIFNHFRRAGTAPLERELLQILLSHKRTVGGKADLLTIFREEILTTIAKHVPLDRENVRVRMDRGATASTRSRSTSGSAFYQYAPRSQHHSIIVSRLGSTTVRKSIELARDTVETTTVFSFQSPLKNYCKHRIRRGWHDVGQLG